MARSLLPAWSKVIQASTAITSDTNVDFDVPEDIVDLKIIIDYVTVTGTSPTCDATFQTSWDRGTTYIMHSRFAQATAAAKRVLDVSRSGGRIIGQEFASADTGGADANSGPFARDCRIRLDVGGTSPSFTCTIQVIGNRAD